MQKKWTADFHETRWRKWKKVNEQGNSAGKLDQGKLTKS